MVKYKMKGEYKMIYLKQAKFCVQCEMIFDDRAEVCPVCWSPSWVPLEKWLNSPKEESRDMPQPQIDENMVYSEWVEKGREAETNDHKRRSKVLYN